MSYRNPVRHQLGHRPLFLVQYGVWVCVSANARGEGRSWQAAHDTWERALHRWYHNPRRIKYLYRWGGRP